MSSIINRFLSFFGFGVAAEKVATKKELTFHLPDTKKLYDAELAQLERQREETLKKEGKKEALLSEEISVVRSQADRLVKNTPEMELAHRVLLERARSLEGEREEIRSRIRSKKTEDLEEHVERVSRSREVAKILREGKVVFSEKKDHFRKGAKPPSIFTSGRPSNWDFHERRIVTYGGKFFLVQLLHQAVLHEKFVRNEWGPGYGGCGMNHRFCEYSPTGEYATKIEFLTLSLSQMTNEELEAIAAHRISE